MRIRYFKKFFFTIVTLLGWAASGFAQKAPDEGHILVSLRKIGHEILLMAGDSTSRILPIEKEGKRYKLQFTSEFHFDPYHLVSLVDNVVKKSQIAGSYLAEVESCIEKQVVYSYETEDSQKPDMVHCRGRIQPKGCYILFFTILVPVDQNPGQDNLILESSDSDLRNQKGMEHSEMVIISLAFLILAGVTVYFMKKRVTTDGNPNLIALGEYQFDTRNMVLRYKNEMAELSSKETELLLLLYTSANSTIEREVILKAVWGDDGDYVGRTLDVFISKLRKKLDADPGIKIVNVRGVGYKLILNE